MYNQLIFTVTVLICLLSCKSTPNEEIKETIDFPVKVGNNPESITKGFDGDYYITVMNGQEEGDAEIVRLSKDGTTSSFFKGGDQPKGIVYLNNHLYFSDVTKVWKVNESGQGEVFIDATAFPEKVRYLNDVSIDENGKGIYVTDMGDNSNMMDENGQFWPLDSEQAKKNQPLGRIYHISTDGDVSIAKDTSPMWVNPNGVGVDNKGNMMIGSFFNGYFLIEKEGKMIPLKGSFRGADAVEQDSKGDYYISSWNQGKVWKIDGKTQESTVLIDGLKSAADFYLEEENNRLLLPDMIDGRVHSVPIN